MSQPAPIDSDTAAIQIYETLQALADRTGTPEAQMAATLAYLATEDRLRVPEDDETGRELSYTAAYVASGQSQIRLRAVWGVRTGVSWERVGFSLGITASESQERYAR